MRLPVHRRRFPVAVLAALGVVLAACETGDDLGVGVGGATGELSVVATTSILGDIVTELVQDDGTVEVLMPPGVDPHGFEPSARDAALLREADLVVVNGLQLEDGLDSALEAAGEDGVEVLELAGHLDPIPFGGGPDGDDGHGHGEDGDRHDDGGGQGLDEGDGHRDEGDGHDRDGDGDRNVDGDGDRDHGVADPHVWHDPVRMADGVVLIAEQLAGVSGGVDAEEWRQRADDYVGALLATHEEVEDILAGVPGERRALVTNHDAFGYLARRYDFEVLGTVIPGSSTDAETNPRAFAELIETVEEAGVPAVFSENVEGDRLSEQLAGEVIDRGDLEIEVIELYSDALGEPGGDGGTYLDMLRTNAQRIADALG